MTRLIDADALLKELKKSCEYHAENSRELSLLQRDIIIVQEQPTVDAVPVRHGRWIYSNNFHWYTASCNKCGYQRRTDIKADGWNQWKYCPNCGADMRDEQDERLNQQTGGD